MELSDNDIASIEAYFDGTLGSEELAAFEQRLAGESEFAAEVEVWRGVFAAVREGGRDQLKTNVASIGAAAIASGGLADYTPSINAPKQNTLPKKGGSGIGGKLFSLVFAGLIGTGLYMWYTDQIPEGWLEFLQMETESDSTSKSYETKIDTIYFEGDEEPAFEDDQVTIERFEEVVTETVWTEVVVPLDAESTEVPVGDTVH